MIDTDWRPTACPACGQLRAASKRPQCLNSSCELYAGDKRSMTPKTHKRYVWIRANGDTTIIDTDIVALWQSPSYDRETDRIYELGAEIEIRVTVGVKASTSYHKANTNYRTSFENR